MYVHSCPATLLSLCRSFLFCLTPSFRVVRYLPRSLSVSFAVSCCLSFFLTGGSVDASLMGGTVMHDDDAADGDA